MRIKHREKVPFLLAGTLIMMIVLVGLTHHAMLIQNPKKISRGIPIHPNNASYPKPLLNNQNKGNNTKILSQAAVDDLITRAANEKYIEDVLNARPALPLSHPPKLKLDKIPANNLTQQSVTTSETPTKEKNLAINRQRCTYNGQSYVPGDVVKTDQGWLRCSSTVVFLNNNTLDESGKPAWTAVQ